MPLITHANNCRSNWGSKLSHFKYRRNQNQIYPKFQAPNCKTRIYPKIYMKQTNIECTRWQHQAHLFKLESVSCMTNRGKLKQHNIKDKDRKIVHLNQNYYLNYNWCCGIWIDIQNANALQGPLHYHLILPFQFSWTTEKFFTRLNSMSQMSHSYSSYKTHNPLKRQHIPILQSDKPKATVRCNSRSRSISTVKLFWFHVVN